VICGQAGISLAKLGLIVNTLGKEDGENSGGDVKEVAYTQP
jgi:hypothetical protein